MARKPPSATVEADTETEELNMTRIIVGVDASERAADAVALAGVLARAAGAELLIAHAYTSEAIPLERHLEAAGVPAHAVPLPGGSPARLLQELAERANAAAIVIGSSHRGELGRVFAGTTAERLLHGAPCPVVVAPRGYAGGELHRILVGHDGGPESQAALEAALAAGADVHLVRVLEPVVLGAQASIAGAWVPPLDIEADARAAFEAEFAGLEDVEREFLVGDPARELARRTERADLAIVGSRGYGPLRSVLLGSVSAKLVRRAACPVMVVPRGAQGEASRLLAATRVPVPTAVGGPS
jgi:nucleotide-binding universal stress UspA family protein